MASASTYVANRILNSHLRGTVYTLPSNLYLACYTSPVTAAGGGTEVNGGSYARASVTFAAASGGLALSNVDVVIAGMPTCTVTYVGIMDSLTGNNLLFYRQLPTQRVLTSGDSFAISSGDLSVAVT